MKSYEILEHTADVGLLIYGETPEKVFSNSIEGLLFLILPNINNCNKNNQKDKFVTINLEATNIEELLVNWINEFIFYFYSKRLVPVTIKINKLIDTKIEAVINFCKNNKELLVEIKAATYHELYLHKTETGYKAKVFFDI